MLPLSYSGTIFLVSCSLSLFSHSLNRQQLRDTVSRMDIFTVNGRYGVDGTGLQIKNHMVVMQVQKGKPEVVWPDDARTARPLFR
jgi:branched-chain amino acid transport system substrate-binding protein